jgi:hypothetical protein
MFRRRFASSSPRILCASHVLTPAALERIMRPFWRCTRRRASATCPQHGEGHLRSPYGTNAPPNARTEPEPVRDPAQALPSWLPGTGGVAPEVVRTRSGDISPSAIATCWPNMVSSALWFGKLPNVGTGTWSRNITTLASVVPRP